MVTVPDGNSQSGPSFTCPTTFVNESSNREESHYVKATNWFNQYEETAILLPFQVKNVFFNSDRAKPYCKIYKQQLVDTPWGKKFRWTEVLHFQYTLEILKYKKMRQRINNLILFS